MNNDIYDILEACLQSIGHGANIDTLLARYPQFADELRPLLEAALSARAIPLPSPSASGMRRGRARFLQKAAEMREAKVAPRSRRSVIPMFQRLAISLGLTFALVFSGTGLVSASSTALPGENLYPVKRTWEDVRLFFVFDPSIRMVRENEYEQERLHEATALLAEGRHEEISFAGVVTEQNGQFYISSLPVILTPETTGVLENGATVMVVGRTDAQGFVVLATVETLPPGSMVPLGKPTKVDSNERAEFHLEGNIDSIQENALTVNGKVVYLENTKIEGKISIGVQVEVEGYFASDGKFIAVQIEVKDLSSDDNSNNVNPNDNNNNDANSRDGNTNDADSNDDNSNGINSNNNNSESDDSSLNSDGNNNNGTDNGGDTGSEDSGGNNSGKDGGGSGSNDGGGGGGSGSNDGGGGGNSGSGSGGD
jgi:uncharacterized membrane protein YgcG